MPKIPASQLAQFVIRNPFTAAAAVFAPIFAKNEDRGYFRTALITTPIVFATGAFVPKLFGGVRDMANAAMESRNILQKSEKWSRFEQPTFNDLKTIFQAPGMSSNTVERNLSAYLVQERKSRDFLKEQKILTKYFNRKFVITQDLIDKSLTGNENALNRIDEITRLQNTHGKLISNALHTAKRSALTPAEWAEGGLESGELTNDQMISMFDKYASSPKFRSTLKSRLQEIVRGKAVYGGTVASAGVVKKSSTMTTAISWTIDDIQLDAATVQLQAQAPGVFDALAEAKVNRFIDSVDIELSKDVVSGKIGKVLNVKVSRPGNTKPLEIPIVDPATGQVRLYDSKQLGVGNFVIGPDLQPHRIDEWIASQLANNPKFTNAQLEEEIAAHAYWMAGDPLDSRRVSELGASGETYTLSEGAIKLRSQAAGITKLPLFEINGQRKSFYDFDFGTDNKTKVLGQLFNDGRYIPMGSEGRIYEGGVQLRSAANLSPFGAVSAEKQDPFWRSLTKEFQLNAPGGLPTEGRLGYRATSWDALYGGELPAATFNIASINPQDRTLFSELPSTLDELHFKRNEVVQKFLNRGLSSENAAGLYNDIYSMYQKGQQGVFSNFGRMGETGFLVQQGYANNFQIVGNKKYRVDELGVKVGDYIDPNTVIGFNNSDRVLPGTSGRVVNVGQDSSGFDVIIQHERNMMGGKLDVAGIKGMVPLTPSNEHFEQMREVVNNLYSRLGSGDFIPQSVNTLAPAEYFADKADPALTYLGIASDVVNRLQAQGATDVTAGYLSDLAKMGIDYSNSQLVIDSSKNILSDKGSAGRLMEFVEISEQFFAKAGEAIRKAGGYQDPVLNAYVHSGKEVGDWMRKNSLPAISMAWDHSKVNVPTFASIGFDFESYMSLGQNYRGLKAVQSRLQTVTGGNVNQARDFMSYLIKGDFSQPLGKSIPINEAFHSRYSLNTAGNRAGSIFDDSIDAYKNNFSVDLGNGIHMPVPGTAAYGAESNQFAPGEYFTHDWQHTLQDLAFAKDTSLKEELRNKLIKQYTNEFGGGALERGGVMVGGKAGALRPRQYDPMGVAGFLSNYAEQGDPFVARVSEDWANRVHSQRVREALLNGEDAIGILHRQPTNELFYLKYRVDRDMNGTMDVAVPESVSRAIMGDQDKDLVNSILFDANVRMQNNKLIVTGAANQMEREAAEEAIEAMAGKQVRQLAIHQSIKGTDEVAALASANWEVGSLYDKAAKFAGRVSDRVSVAMNRTAGATIGAYSNVLTQMVEQMVDNPAMMRDPDLVQRLKTGLFDIRQAPISARKAHVTYDLETAMKKIDVIRRGLDSANPETAFKTIHPTLLNMSENLIGKDSGAFEYWAGQGAEDLQAWAAARTERAAMAAAAFTASAGKTESVVKEVFSKGFADILGPSHGGGQTMSAESASALGNMSEYLVEKARETARAGGRSTAKMLAEHGTGIALGLGALAALGVAMTSKSAPVASFSRASGNRYRPEDRVGIDGHIPGESMEGQMAPSIPPRRPIDAQPGVRTMVATNMNQTSDLTARMRATDSTTAAETARQLATIPGSGNTNVTINYRDRTKLRSLRTREKIREIMR